MHPKVIALYVLMLICISVGFCSEPDNAEVEAVLTKLILAMGEDRGLAGAALAAEAAAFAPGSYQVGSIGYEVKPGTRFSDSILNGQIDSRLLSLDLGDGILVSGLVSQTFVDFVMSDQVQTSGHISLRYDLDVIGCSFGSLLFISTIDQSSSQITGVAEAEGIVYEINVLDLLAQG